MERLERREVLALISKVESEVYNLDDLKEDDYEEHDECRNKIMALLDEIRDYVWTVPLP